MKNLGDYIIIALRMTHLLLLAVNYMSGLALECTLSSISQLLSMLGKQRSFAYHL